MEVQLDSLGHSKRALQHKRTIQLEKQQMARRAAEGKTQHIVFRVKLNRI